MQKSGEFDSDWLAYLCTYLSWVGYTELLVLSSATFVHYMAPQAIGKFLLWFLLVWHFRQWNPGNEDNFERRNPKRLPDFQDFHLKGSRTDIFSRKRYSDWQNGWVFIFERNLTRFVISKNMTTNFNPKNFRSICPPGVDCCKLIV
jgi:hypothetical protein